jgi:hypothetical protein
MIIMRLNGVCIVDVLIAFVSISQSLIMIHYIMSINEFLNNTVFIDIYIYV